MEHTQTVALKDLLAGHTREGSLYRDLGNGRIECFSCGHRCAIGNGRDGICRVRFNRDGKLYVPWGYVASLQLDPVEKKPFFHALPGSMAMSFGMLGCDYHCGYCQNWITSQALRDPAAIAGVEEVTPEDIVSMAHRHRASIITSTYNEPLITSEWAVDVFKLAKRYGFVTSYVSNGNGTPEVVDFLAPWVDLYKIDLKGMNDRKYRSLGGVLATVLDTIRRVHGKGMWIEVVTLVVPGHNDSEGELREIARFLVSVSPDIPWHVTAFHSDYKMDDTPNTPVRTLMRAAEIGYESGLRYVYAGNIPGRSGRYENTVCPSCGKAVIERDGFRILGNVIKEGRCPFCSSPIAGYWKRPAS